MRGAVVVLFASACGFSVTGATGDDAGPGPSDAPPGTVDAPMVEIDAPPIDPFQPAHVPPAGSAPGTGDVMLDQDVDTTALTIGGIVMLPFSPYGLIGIVWAAAGGLECEVPFLAARYRKYSTSFLMLGGAVATLISTLLEYPLYGHAALALGVQITMLAVTVLSGALGGLLSKLLADAMLKAGFMADYRRSFAATDGK